jgi:hypothetical protein
MTDANFPMSPTADMDDLPRTLRRERERQKAAQQGAMPSGLSAQPGGYSQPSIAAADDDDPVPAAVKRIDVSFFRLMGFFIKAVLAAIPALVLLGVLLWFAGYLLQSFYPDLIQTKIVICSPSNPKGCP